MSKYILAAIAAMSVILAPMAATAQETGSGKTDEMKGPPNADGYKDDAKKSGDGKDAGGAAAAKSTGEDKK